MTHWMNDPTGVINNIHIGRTRCNIFIYLFEKAENFLFLVSSKGQSTVQLIRHEMLSPVFVTDQSFEPCAHNALIMSLHAWCSYGDVACRLKLENA